MKRWILALAFLGVLGVMMGVFAGAFGKDPRKVPFGMKGKPAPTFALTELLTDKQVSLEELAGQPVVINFWASWCGPCAMEHPNLEWAAKKYRGKVTFLGMIFEDTPENARQFLARNGSGYGHLVDPHSLTSVKYGAAGVPETYFITADGIILDKYAGPIPQRVLAERVEELLALAAANPTARGASR